MSSARACAESDRLQNGIEAQGPALQLWQETCGGGIGDFASHAGRAPPPPEVDFGHAVRQWVPCTSRPSAEKAVSFSQLFLCLSRACLGKVILLSMKRRKKEAFPRTGGEVPFR